VINIICKKVKEYYSYKSAGRKNSAHAPHG